MTTSRALHRLQRFATAWDAWWLAEGPPHALAITRIGIGVYLLIAFGLKFPHARMLLSSDGLILPYTAPWMPGWLHALLIPPSPIVAQLLLAGFLLSIVTFTIGAAMRTSIVVMLLFYAYYFAIDLHQYWVTYEKLITFALLILLFSGADRTYSVVMKRRHGSWCAWEHVSLLPQRLIALQITATYLGVGWQKVWLPGWQSGEILRISLISRWGSPPAFAFVRILPSPSVFNALVTGVKLFECTIPVGLWIRSTRKWFMLGGTAFHLSIAVLLQIWQFLVLVPAYALFIEPAEIVAWLRLRFPRCVGKEMS